MREIEIVELATTGVFDVDRARHADVLVHNAKGSYPPLYLLRTWSRNGLYLRDLAAHLDPEQPLYSLAPPHFEEIAAYPDTVGEWADFMLTRLAAISNEGCYRIGGYSFGGLVALEMAERLAAQGAEIPLVLLLDTWLPLKRRKPRAERSRRAKRLARFGTELQQYAEIPSRRERRAYLWQQYSPTRRSSRREAKRKKRRSEQHSRFLAGDGVIAGQIMKNASGVEISFLKRAIQVAYLKYTQQATELPLALIRTRKSQPLL